jgi:transcriptional regulator with XRE-family HTH domain
MTPGDIKKLRKQLNLSRARLSELTGMGKATIARWERGATIQNVAMDRYLRLIAKSGNVAALQQMAGGGQSAGTSIAADPLFGEYRRIRVTPNLRAQSQSFELRKTG